MDYPECYRLTFCGIVVAFMEIAFAYCLVCVSAFVFIASKLLVYVPCPCSGILGYQNSDLCVHKLLLDWPFTVILRIIQKVAAATSTSRRIIWHQEEEEKKKMELMDKVRWLEEARAALMVELEVERAASASAVDEAMAMIQRLQADKASVEMERKQYKRMSEEIFAYDEGEMNILKEILYKRDIEKHFLEKELEAHKHIGDTEMKDVHVVKAADRRNPLVDDDIKDHHHH